MTDPTSSHSVYTPTWLQERLGGAPADPIDGELRDVIWRMHARVERRQNQTGLYPYLDDERTGFELLSEICARCSDAGITATAPGRFNGDLMDFAGMSYNDPTQLAVIVTPQHMVQTHSLLVRCQWQSACSSATALALISPVFGVRHYWHPSGYRLALATQVPGIDARLRGRTLHRAPATPNSPAHALVLAPAAQACFLCARWGFPLSASAPETLVLAAMAVREVPEWPELVTQAYTLGMARIVHDVIVHAQRQLGMRYPQHVRSTLRFLPTPIGIRVAYELSRREVTRAMGRRMLRVMSGDHQGRRAVRWLHSVLRQDRS